MSNKPYIFVGCSAENLPMAYQVQQRLQYTGHVTVWSQGVFEPSKTAVESLLKELSKCDFGIFLFMPDDILKIRDNETTSVRDNVIFEMGLFVGRLGRERCFLIQPRNNNLHLPSDLVGFTPALFDSTHPSIAAAIGGACTPIEQAILELGKIFNNENKCIAKKECKDESSYSTGAAIELIGLEISRSIREGKINSLKDIIATSEQIAKSARGSMLHFCHFVKIGPYYPLSRWITPSVAMADYLSEYLSFIRKCNEKIGQNLGRLLIGKRAICITEYSRAVLSGIFYRLRTGDPLVVYIVDRLSKAAVPEEVQAIEERLAKKGAIIEKKMNLEEWILFLDNIAINGGAGIDYILFGAEAVTHTGDNVFPQIITGNEIEKLVAIKKISCVTKTVCVAESYKFLTKSAYNDAASMPNKANYTLISNSVFDEYISEHCIVEKKDIANIEANWLHSCDEARRILYNILESENLIAFDYCPDSVLKRIRLVAADIDDTITIGGKICPEIIMSFNKLCNIDIKLVLVTGRSSGWAQAIISYFPAIDYIIAENGAIIIDRSGKIDFPSSEGKQYDTSILNKEAGNIKKIHNLTETQDSVFRLREITFNRPSLFSERDIEKLNNIVSPGIEIIASSIHIHLRFKGIDKGMSLRMLNKDKYNFSQEEIVVIGDSATDASLFNFFKISIGVANILNYTAEISPDLPKFITKELEGNGFLELVNRLHSVHNP